MNPRAEMCKTMHTYGEPLKLFNGSSFVNGAGVFEKIYDKTPEKERKIPIKTGIKNSKKYSLWAYDFSRIEKVDKVIADGIIYTVLSGDYDEQMGCFRLIVKEEKNETSRNL